MKQTLLTLSTFFIFLIAGNAHAEKIQPLANIKVTNAYSFETTSVQKNGAVFFEIENPGDADLKLVSAEADVSETVELHTHIMEDDKMMMRQVEAYDIPAGSTLKLEPMGHHIMLMNLKEPLSMDENAGVEELKGKFPLLLRFDDGSAKTVQVDIIKPGTTPKQDHEHSHSHH